MNPIDNLVLVGVVFTHPICNHLQMTSVLNSGAFVVAKRQNKVSKLLPLGFSPQFFYQQHLLSCVTRISCEATIEDGLSKYLTMN